MVESDKSQYSGFKQDSPDSFVPDGKLVVPCKRKVTEEELPGIFGVDVRWLTQNKLIELGLILPTKRLDLWKSPKTHTYKSEDVQGNIVTIESDGQYFLEIDIDEHFVLVSYLPPFSWTSEHNHDDPIRETYHQIAGESFVRIGNNPEVSLIAGKFLEVPPNTEHQSSTKDNPAFTLIVMDKAALFPRDKRHNPTNKFNGKNKRVEV